MGICDAIWTGGGLLYGPRFDVHGGPAAGREQGATAQSGSPDPDRPGAARVGNRLDRGLFPASKRTRGAEFSDRSGPADQAASPGQGEDDAGGQRVSEKEYWPEWNAKFTHPARGKEDLHRPLAEGFELGSALSHVEHRIITNNYTFPYYSQNYQIVREDVQAGMKRQSLRVELWLSGELKARYQGRYVEVRSVA